MSQERNLDILFKKREKILAGGGDARIKKQHEAGKYTARERLQKLMDENSFVEVDQFVVHRGTDLGMDKVEAPGEGVVTGYGTIDGRLVYVYAQDFTVIGGTLGEMHAKKICKVMDMALKMGAPIIGINDSGGARIQEGLDALNGFAEIFKRNTLASGVIPQISVIMGPCAGGAVYSPAITDFIFMVEKTSQMFITGPQVIRSVTGEDVDAEGLGGAKAHATKSGCAHFVAKNEDECFDQIKNLLSYLPENNLEEAPWIVNNDSPNRRELELKDVIPNDPNKSYDIKKIIEAVADNQTFFEIQENYAPNILVGFIRLYGKTVGVVANQPKSSAGCLDIDAADKSSRFVRYCDAFSIPLLTFVDTPGYLPGVSQEHNGIIRHGAKLLYAFSEATVPKITVITRKAYGGAYIAMCSKGVGADTVIAWPSAEIAVMGAQGAANIVFRKEIEKAEDPIAKRSEKIQDYQEQFSNPYRAAERGLVDHVIEPENTRPLIIKSLEMLLSKRENRPAKKHGNIPL